MLSLIDEGGCFYADAEIVSARAQPGEVYIELKAQISKALATGVKPTHVDTHMFALFYNDDDGQAGIRGHSGSFSPGKSCRQVLKRFK